MKELLSNRSPQVYRSEKLGPSNFHVLQTRGIDSATMRLLKSYFKLFKLLRKNIFDFMGHVSIRKNDYARNKCGQNIRKTLVRSSSFKPRVGPVTLAGQSQISNAFFEPLLL